MQREVPPHSIPAEQAVIGGLLIDTGAISQVADVLRPADFYQARHREAFTAALAVDGQGEDVDLLTVLEALRQAGTLDEAGGKEYLGQLARDTPSAVNIRAYAEIVRDRAVERELIQAGRSFERIVQEPGGVGVKLDRAQQAVLDIGRETGGGPALVRESMPAWVNQMDERANKTGDITGIPTGYLDVDRLLGGLERGALIIVAGRPSMGKTAIALCMGGNIADAGHTVAVFSMEMPTDQLIDRQVSSRSGVPLNEIRSGRLADNGWRRITDASTEVTSLPLVIDDSGVLTVTDVRARARRIKQRHGLGLILIDYLQLMSGRGENRNLEVSEISRGLKQLAKELNVPVIALSQLNRSLENRPDKRPRMSDLRESGSLEQDADVIAFVYRDEVYNEDSPDKGTAEFIIGKQRNGPTGTVRLIYEGECTRFHDCTPEAYDEVRRRNIARQEAAQREAEQESGCKYL
ncbi:replicative DNA helicase [Arhodomonas sp. AD133]|uniref:replicative DNA helicase n=1 Tax=Arhodomonas sp. AD133 TaxID=3415009 RepID=UPI003EBFB4DC